MVKIQPCLRNAAEVRHVCGFGLCFWFWCFFPEQFFNCGCTVQQLLPLGNQHLQGKQQWYMGWVPSKRVAGPALSNACTSNCGRSYCSLFWGRSSFSLPVINTILFYSAPYAFQGLLTRKNTTMKYRNLLSYVTQNSPLLIRIQSQVHRISHSFK